MIEKCEAAAIKVMAALAAAPRWVTALMPADHAVFPWGGAIWWQVTSAILSLMFAAVEVWATAFIMRAWRDMKPGSLDEHRLRWLWITSLVLLVVIMAPAV